MSRAAPPRAAARKEHHIMAKKKKPTREMLINTVAGQECRIAIVSDQGLEELYVERTATASHVGNIYKGKVTNVESSIQAAFVDIGLGKNGFLHISDVNPTYFPKGKKGPEPIGRKRPHYVRPPIQECLKRGQEVVVQMTKEGIGTKGPTMTTYLSIPGRLLVMMPGMTRLGVSRKVEDEGARSRARAALNELKLPQDIGFIVRTAGVDRSKRDLQRDLNYLTRLWQSVKKRIKKARPPVELYRESDLVTRTIRDIYNSDIGRIVCDSAAVARQVDEFLSVAVPRTKHNIEVYTGREGLFYDVGLDEEIERIHSRRVEMRSGGSLVIDQTEALVAIDVNSGRFRQHSDAETTATKINQEAAKEIVRQLRLRDLGGVIVIDFIDMRDDKNRRAVERTLREAIKDDRAKTKVLRMGAFCMVQLTRQRLGPSLKQSVFDRCPHCDGMGLVKSPESLALLVMRDLQRAAANDDVATVRAKVPLDVAHFLSNRQRTQVARLEARAGKRIVIAADPDTPAGTSEIECTNARGSVVAWEQAVGGKRGKTQPQTVPIAELPDEPQQDDGLPQPPPAAPDGAQPVQGGVPDKTDDGDDRDDQGSGSSKRKRSRRGRRGGRKHRRNKSSDQDDRKDGQGGKDQTDEGGRKQDGGEENEDRGKQGDKRRDGKDDRSRGRDGKDGKDDRDAKDKDRGDREKPEGGKDTGEKKDEGGKDDKPDASRKRRRRRRKPASDATGEPDSKGKDDRGDQKGPDDRDKQDRGDRGRSDDSAGGDGDGKSDAKDGSEARGGGKAPAEDKQDQDEQAVKAKRRRRKRSTKQADKADADKDTGDQQADKADTPKESPDAPSGKPDDGGDKPAEDKPKKPRRTRRRKKPANNPDENADQDKAKGDDTHNEGDDQ